jgi:uncharacterized membrane protein YfcA
MDALLQFGSVYFILYVLIGAAAGLLGGLLGISGGVVTVPCLITLFRWLDFPESALVQMAMGTSLAAMVFNALASTWSHHRKGGVLWDVVYRMTPGLLAGAAAGASFAALLPGAALQMVFGLFAICLGVVFFFPHTPHEGAHRLPQRGRTWILSGIGAGIAGLANLLGIGGGIVTVPVLIRFRIPLKQAVGTSAATGMLISCLGAASYLYLGKEAGVGQDSVGYIYLPAFALIGLAAFFSAPLGAKLAYTLSPPLLRRLFAAALMLTGTLLLF